MKKEIAPSNASIVREGIPTYGFEQSFDILSPEGRSAQMARVRSKDTKPEMVVRRLVHGMGYRYRLHDRRLPGSPDLVFRKRKRLIFVHGCFWHRHEGCARNRTPKSRVDFWEAKLEGNRLRDLRVRETLEADGWKLLVLWECEIARSMRAPDELAGRIRSFLEEAI